MKLRLFLFISLSLHVLSFFLLRQDILGFLFPQPVQDLAAIEMVEMVSSRAETSKRTQSRQPISAPVSVTKKSSTDSPPAENLPSTAAATGLSEAKNRGGQNSFEAVSVGAVTNAPKVLKEKRIAYPERARRAGVEGVVELKLVVDARGLVREAEVVKGLGYGLDEAALVAMKEFEFSPALIGADPVAVRIIYKYRFQLNR